MDIQQYQKMWQNGSTNSEIDEPVTINHNQIELIVVDEGWRVFPNRKLRVTDRVVWLKYVGGHDANILSFLSPFVFRRWISGNGITHLWIKMSRKEFRAMRAGKELWRFALWHYVKQHFEKSQLASYLKIIQEMSPKDCEDAYAALSRPLTAVYPDVQRPPWLPVMHMSSVGQKMWVILEHFKNV